MQMHAILTRARQPDQQSTGTLGGVLSDDRMSERAARHIYLCPCDLRHTATGVFDPLCFGYQGSRFCLPWH
jgi:hypothetical protein